MAEKKDPIKEQYEVLIKKVKEINKWLKEQPITADNVKELQDVMKNMDPINKMIIHLRGYVEKYQGTKDGAESISEYHESN